MEDRNKIIKKVFNHNLADYFDKDAVAEEEETLMKKLMKRYERVELQYNLNNARSKLISGYDSMNDNHSNRHSANEGEINKK